MPNPISSLFYMGLIVSTASVFTNYCLPGLCVWNGGDGKHTGCRNNVPHNGKFQPSCPKDAVMITLTKDLQKLIIDQHNTQRNFVAGGGLRPFGIRSACRIGALKWDEELRLTAELHVKDCIFTHDKCRNTIKYPLSGQNIGQNIYNKISKLNVTHYILKFMNLWYQEYVNVKQDTIDSFVRQPVPMIGHFLTLVNERNGRIGCAAVNFEFNASRTIFMMTCNYPSTSITKGTIYNSCKIPGARCTSGRDPRYPNLCSTSEEYNMEGKLEFIPYDNNDNEDNNIDYGMKHEKETSHHNKKPINDNERENDPDSSSTLSLKQYINKIVVTFSITTSLFIISYLESA